MCQGPVQFYKASGYGRKAAVTPMMAGPGENLRTSEPNQSARVEMDGDFISTEV